MWGHYVLGMAAYERDEASAAAQHFVCAAELRHAGNTMGACECLGRMALAHQALGLSAAADATVVELRDFADEAGHGQLRHAASAYEARLALMQGHIADALKWALGESPDPTPHLLFAFNPQLARLLILVASGQPDHARTALSDADALLARARAMHNVWRCVELQAVRAMALDVLNRTTESLDALQEAVALAEHGGFVRTFVDHGPRMARLLDLLRARRTHTAYIERVLTHFAPMGVERSPASGEANRTEQPAWLTTPLTRRELQVLEQLARRRSDKEIAQALVISPLTVKAHTDHIYRKLEVTNRNDAVRAALAFGILGEVSPNAG